MARLSGKIAIVTGAGGGIGQAIAQRFAVEGAHVWVTDINGETAEETVRGIKAAGGAATAMMVDVSKGQDLTALVRKVDAAHGRADVLVNNAGILVRGEVRQLSDDEWTRLREVNVDAVLRLSRDALPLLRKSKSGSLINISSIMAHRGLRPLGGLHRNERCRYCADEGSRRRIRAVQRSREFDRAGLCGNCNYRSAFEAAAH